MELDQGSIFGEKAIMSDLPRYKIFSFIKKI